jgi:hypothetical protein
VPRPLRPEGKATRQDGHCSLQTLWACRPAVVDGCWSTPRALRGVRHGQERLTVSRSRASPQFQAKLEQGTLLKRLPTLAEVADTAAVVASDRARAMTATVANFSAGSITD